MEQKKKLPTHPDWSKAPKWAKWFAIDWDGEGYFYKSKPISNGVQWCLGGKSELCGMFNSWAWQNSLQQRPAVDAQGGEAFKR